LTEPSAPRHATRSRLLWTAAIVVLAIAVLVLSERHGHASRIGFAAPPELVRRPVAAVGSAAEAFVVWRGSEVRGRRLVLLTGRWGAAPREAAPPGGATGSPGVGSGPTADKAPYWAARLGLARVFDVVMPPAEFEERRAVDAGHKEYRPETGAYRHDIHGFHIRVSSPAAFVRPDEPVLVLVEPTWFRPGAPPDPLAWLESAGVQTDLALVALDDPSATDADRAAAAAYVEGARIPRLEIELTP
jgi:hypothetical protein